MPITIIISKTIHAACGRYIGFNLRLKPQTINTTLDSTYKLQVSKESPDAS